LINAVFLVDVVLMVVVRFQDRVHVVQTLTVQVRINVVIINVVTWIRMSFVAKIRTAVNRFRNVVKMVRVSHLVNVVEMVTVIQMKSVAVIIVFHKMSVVITQTAARVRYVVMILSVVHQMNVVGFLTV
jgi:hypothetical protein